MPFKVLEKVLFQNSDIRLALELYTRIGHEIILF